jgi:hypothetical protein
MPVDQMDKVDSAKRLDGQGGAADDDDLDDDTMNDDGTVDDEDSAGDGNAVAGGNPCAPARPAAASTCLAAILLYGGKHGGDARDILETFDFWALTTDIQKIAHAPLHKLVIADSEKEIEQRLAERYEAPHGFTMLHREEREVRQGRQEIKTWRGTRSEFLRREVDGWRVLTAPMFMGRLNSEQHLLSLCIQHRQFIIDAASVEALGGAKYLESRSYVVTGAGSEGIYRIRWNPLLWQQREYRAEKATAEKRLRDTLPNHLLNDFGDCLNPSHWPNRHPFHGMFDGIKGALRGSGWHSTWREQAQYGIDKVAAYIRANLRLTPHLRPWRSYRGRRGDCQENRTYRRILQEALDHVHGIRRNKSKDYRLLRRWLLAEARAMRLAIPLPPRMPAGPEGQSTPTKAKYRTEGPARQAA